MAEESTKVRLVRCPKCENLLPELQYYSVYQCGGCDAVLRAKNKNPEGDNLSEKSDEEMVVGLATKLQVSSEKGTLKSSDAGDTNIKSNAGTLRSNQMNLEKTDVVHADRGNNQRKATSGKWVAENGLEAKMDRDAFDSVVGRENHNDLNVQSGYTNGSWRSGQGSGWQREERGETEGFRRNTRTEVEAVRFSTSNYAAEGPSNYHLNSSQSRGELARHHNDQDGTSRIQYLENDRAELLRKLDELKDQLNRSYEVGDRSKVKVHCNGRMAPPESYVNSYSSCPGTSSASDRASTEFFVPDKHAAAPSYFSHPPEPFSYINGHDMPVHGFHVSMQKSHHLPGYGDPFGSRMVRGAPHQLTGQFQLPSHQYISGRYFDNGPDSDPYEMYTANVPFHQSSCSCFHCYDKHLGVSGPVPSSAFGNKKFTEFSINPVLHQHEDHGPYGPRVHDSRNAFPPPRNSGAPLLHARWPSDLNSEMGGFGRGPRRVFLAAGGRSCRPIAGGAPFITCFNCFELLKLPKKILLKAKNQHKMQCGSCSARINFCVVNKRLVLSVSIEASRIPAEVDDSSNEMMKDPYNHDRIDQSNVNFSSDDYDNSDYDFQTVDRDPVASSIGQGFTTTNPQEMRNSHSSSQSSFEDENSPDILIAPRKVIDSVQQPIRGTLSPPPPGSPLQQHFDYSLNNHVVSRFEKGNRSSRFDKEKVITSKAVTLQNSMKETSLATEMDLPFHEFANTGVSQDSEDTTREDSLPKNHKGGDSFFANIMKKSFKDFSKPNQTDDHGRSNDDVYVNGHLIPDRVLKKAEKLAGSIHPGRYWYDFRAGFWGVMGGHCLGIIPPFIEEFNYAMPENCAGGTTGVFVNGRELHQKDLDLLASRGLPTQRDRSYIIEISGKVLDEDTGEELDGLGKLAPTVQKKKHGFGMKAPKAAAN